LWNGHVFARHFRAKEYYYGAYTFLKNCVLISECIYNLDLNRIVFTVLSIAFTETAEYASNVNRFVIDFLKDFYQRKYVQHVRGQITKLFPLPILINIYTMTKVKHS
jgi:hypothetical protein